MEEQNNPGACGPYGTTTALSLQIRSHKDVRCASKKRGKHAAELHLEKAKKASRFSSQVQRAGMGQVVQLGTGESVFVNCRPKTSTVH